MREAIESLVSTWFRDTLGLEFSEYVDSIEYSSLSDDTYNRVIAECLGFRFYTTEFEYEIKITQNYADSGMILVRAKRRNSLESFVQIFLSDFSESNWDRMIQRLFANELLKQITMAPKRYGPVIDVTPEVTVDLTGYIHRRN